MRDTLDWLEIVAAVNDDGVYKDNLCASPCVAAGTKVSAWKGYSSVGSAYEDARQYASADVIVFAHQDVYLPNGWEKRLALAISAIEERFGGWAVIGLVGMTPEGELVGRTWSNGLCREVGTPLSEPRLIVSADELVLVVNNTVELGFDRSLPGFHLYGTDIVQNGLKHGLPAYVVDNPVIHNSLPVNRLGSDYFAAYRYMQEKWRDRLPVPTTVLKLQAGGLPIAVYTVRKVWRLLKTLGRRPTVVHRSCAVQELAHVLGYCSASDGIGISPKLSQQ